MVAHAYKTRTWKAEAEGLRVQGQTGLHSEGRRMSRGKKASRGKYDDF
jgi:hypothetical protein